MPAARSNARGASATTTNRVDDDVTRAFGASGAARSNAARAKRKNFASGTAGASRTVAAERERAIPKGEACDALPMDWTIKSSVRLSSRARSFRWGTCAGANATSEGLRAYSGGDASSLSIDDGESGDGGDDDDESEVGEETEIVDASDVFVRVSGARAFG